MAKRGPDLPVKWQAKFLAHYAEHGGIFRSAAAVDVSPETVRRYRIADPDFDQQVKDAREYYADTLEQNMLASAERSDNPVPWIVRLKALRPHEYIEKHAVMNFTVSAHLDSDDTAQILREMLADLSPHTLQQLQHAPPALPPATEPGP